jgi:hypothetical protein
MLFTTIDLTIGLIAAFLFLFRNPQLDFKYLIVASILGLLLIPTAYLYFPNRIVGDIAWGVSAAGLLIFYSLRFRAKTEKTAIDILKFLAIIILIIYPFTSGANPFTKNGFFWALMNNMTFFFVGTVYIYDRLILKQQHTMNKRFILILAAQTLLIGFLWAYGFAQKNEADRNADDAYRQRQISEEIQFENVKLKEELKNCR